MARWKTDEMIELLESIPGVRKIENTGPGGDVDSDNLVIYVSGSSNRLFVAAFDPEHTVSNPSDNPFPMVEVSDGTDSRGGFQQFRDAALGKVYLAVCDRLIGYGFQVVPCLKDYF